MNKVYLIFLCCYLFSCTKDKSDSPKNITNVSFSSEKSEYFAGETIHWINTSINGESFLWTDPEGKTYHTIDLNYLSDSDAILEMNYFSLDVLFKNGITSRAIQSVLIKEVISNSEYFTDSIRIYKPKTKFCYVKGDHWVITQGFDSIISGIHYYSHYWSLYLPGSSVKRAGGLFELHEDTNNLAPNQACIIFDSQSEELTSEKWSSKYATSFSGQLNITISKSGKMYCDFSNIFAICKNQYWFDGNLTTWSTNIHVSGKIAF